MTTPRLLIALLAAAAFTIAACGDAEEEQDGQAAAPTASAGPSCEKADLELKTGGQLTVGTDKPAFPPYFVDDDPTNGKGFESAVAYAIADKLGFDKSEVKWKVVPFNASFKPGPKDFDFDVNQISISEQRQRAVDFSDPYYESPQAVIAQKKSTAAGAGSLAELKDTQIGVQIGTTSLDAVNESIQPSKQPKVFDDSNATVTALKQNQVEAVVTDLPTALYLTAAEIPSATVVGQFSAPGGDTWGALLEKDSSLTDCVSKAISDLRESGELEQITDKWMGSDTAPELN
ncbi:MAG TPA: transporter substrate-binding domain-containing protein [Solirubrobacteraceae bacterium]|nr:transporter substrate-binding domain-containing protein [Solirubrobacteraceae bacterium]